MSTSDATTEALSGKPMSFRDHLMELRRRIVRITIVLLVGTFLTWEYRTELFDFMSKPVADALADNGIYHFQAIQLTESIVVYLKVTVVGAIFLLSPYIFWELWGFISPGLYKKEKRFILPLTAFSVIFFMIGAAFAYTIIIPFITNWLVDLTLTSGHVDVTVTLQNAYSFSFLFLVMFGAVFELPLVLFFLALWGLVTAKGLLKFWRYFVVISFIVCGILTPPDPLSQSLMAIPVNVLYGFGVIVAMTVARAKKRDQGDVSRRAIRAMALSLLGVTAATIVFFLVLTGLPRAELPDWAPLDAPFVAGFNPRVLAHEKALLGVVRADPDAALVLDGLSKANINLDDVTDGALIVNAAGDRIVLLRSDDIGTLVTSLPGDVGVRVIDDDTLAFGRKAALAALAVPDRSRTKEEDRLVQRLEKSGPVWALVERPSNARSALVGADNAGELGAFGAALGLDQRRQLTFDIPIEDKEVANRIEVHIEAARVAALARSADSRTAIIVDALKTIAAELAPLAPPTQRPKLEAVSADLDRLTPAPPPSTSSRRSSRWRRTSAACRCGATSTA
ncbi:MAG: twin-arginine translocase subunit TatC [Myxococcota bacterium]